MSIFFDAFMCCKCSRIIPPRNTDGVATWYCEECGSQRLKELSFGYFPNAEKGATPDELERHFGVV